MEVSLNKSLVDLDLKKIEEANMGKILANALQSSRTGDALKFWDWAVKLHSGKKLDLDPSDFATLKKFVEEEQSFPVLTKAQLLTELNNSSAKK
jgi:hypothetical protein